MNNFAILFLSSLLLLWPFQVSADTSDAVFQMLSSQHAIISDAALLEKQSGGADQLVTRLMRYRTNETVPFVGPRAEKLLLEYAEREDVIQILEADIASRDLPSLARVIAVHLSVVKNDSSRERLAGALLKKAAVEADFIPYARVMLESGDEKVRSLAQKSLK